MAVPSTAFPEGVDPLGWLEEFQLAQHRACVTLLAHLATTGIVPADDGLLLYLKCFEQTFDDREAELAVLPIQRAKDTQLHRQYVAQAREVYQREASSRYLKDVVKSATKGRKRKAT